MREKTAQSGGQIRDVHGGVEVVCPDILAIASDVAIVYEVIDE
jgi:hypothetical protein